MAEDLFLFDYPISQYVKIGQDYYKVVGVVSEQTRSTFESNPAESAAAGKTQTGTSVGKIYIPLNYLFYLTHRNLIMSLFGSGFVNYRMNLPWMLHLNKDGEWSTTHLRHKRKVSLYLII